MFAPTTQATTRAHCAQRWVWRERANTERRGALQRRWVSSAVDACSVDASTVAETKIAVRSASPRALTVLEQERVPAVLHEDRCVDLAPAQVYARLLDEGVYLCSERTMYRILAARSEVRERRAQRRLPRYAAPELLATQPNELWSWDITKVKGPTPSLWYHLYVMLDVFSRCEVGWILAPKESAALATTLMRACCKREVIGSGHLAIHADRGASMKSKPVALLLAHPGTTPSIATAAWPCTIRGTFTRASPKSATRLTPLCSLPSTLPIHTESSIDRRLQQHCHAQCGSTHRNPLATPNFAQ